MCGLLDLIGETYQLGVILVRQHVSADSNNIDTASRDRTPKLQRVKDSMPNQIRSHGSEVFHDLAPNPQDAHDILQHENAWIRFFYVLDNLVKLSGISIG